MAPLAPANLDTRSRSVLAARSSSISGKDSLQKYLINCKSFYSCIYCRTHLANHDELVSRSFQGNHGRAYLFNSVINISCGEAVQRELNTGSHAVADIFCENCGTTLGWKYEKAYVETQKYKEGKFIIELAHVVRENRHLELDKGETFLGRTKPRLYKPQNSLSPPSPSHLSSPTNSLEDEMNTNEDDDELMFAFYDDFYSEKSSFPSSLSSNYHSKIRRSLYLESTPYDWKHTNTSSNDDSNTDSGIGSSNGSSDGNKRLLLRSLDLSSKSASSSPSDKDILLKQSERFFQESSSAAATIDTSSHNIRGFNGENDAFEMDNELDENETQFNFESEEAQNNPNNREQNNNCDQSDSGIKSKPSSFLSSTDSTSVSATTNDKVDGTLNDNEHPTTTATTSVAVIVSTPIVTSGDINSDNSISLDDEEFYDCFTDHDITIMTTSDSTDTLKS